MTHVIPDENANWRDGDILTLGSTGTPLAPTPNGALAAFAGPDKSVITLGVTASAGKPATTYFGVVTYVGAANIESQVSEPFVINCPFGFLPTVSVSSVGAPSGATDFETYLGVIPGAYFRQAVLPGTALDATFTGANPLTNHAGVVRAATGDSTNLVGIASEDSDRYFAGFPGGSQQAGSRAPFGASQSMSPGWDNDTFKLPVAKLSQGYFVMNLLQPWFSSLENTAAGIAIDSAGIASGFAATNFFIVDNTQTACLTIIRRVITNPSVNADGDIGARVLVSFDAAALV